MIELASQTDSCLVLLLFISLFVFFIVCKITHVATSLSGSLQEEEHTCISFFRPNYPFVSLLGVG